MLALFDSRIRSIHPEFYLPSESVCDRLDYWGPTYALETAEGLHALLEASTACGTRVESREVERVFIRDGRSNELILSELFLEEPGSSSKI